MASSSTSSSSQGGSPRAPLDGISELLEHISELRVRDIDDLQQQHAKGAAAAARSDRDVALLLFAEEAEGLLNISKDYKRERYDSEELLERLLEMEETARHDHACALALSAGRPLPPRAAPRLGRRGRGSVNNAYSGDEQPLFRAQSTQVMLTVAEHRWDASSCEDAVEEEEQESQSHDEPEYPTEDPSPPQSCAICGDSISGKFVRLDCAHALDLACLREMFENAVAAKSLFEPPQCCHVRVELSIADEHLDRVLVREYQEKMREFQVPAGDRVYCHSCSSFLGSHSLAPSTLRCVNCVERTCAGCGGHAHPGEACQEAGEGPVLDMAAERGWQRCVSCKFLVERREGCPHMNCICGAQFCYLCGSLWGKCGGICKR